MVNKAIVVIIVLKCNLFLIKSLRNQYNIVLSVNNEFIIVWNTLSLLLVNELNMGNNKFTYYTDWCAFISYRKFSCIFEYITYY